MAVKPIQSVAVAAANPIGSTRARQAQRMLQSLGRPLDSSDPTVIRETTAQMVSELFYKPMLAEIRRSPFGASWAHGGRTEQIFGEMLDERISDGVAASVRGGLVDQVAGRLTDAAEVRRTGVPADTGLNQANWQTQLQAQHLPEGCNDES